MILDELLAIPADATTATVQGVEMKLIVSSNFASADFRKIKTYNFRKSESY